MEKGENMKRKTKKIFGSEERPRLAVYRGIKNIHAQIIDDVSAKTIVSASTVDPKIKKQVKNGGNIEAAKVVGKEIAKRAVEKKIKKVVFDRRKFLYHGRVKTLADAAREGGLEF